MNQYKLLSLTGIALAGTLVATKPVQALTFSLNNVTNGVFSYDITLAPGEGLSNSPFAQPLTLTNLGGVTNASANSIYSLVGFTDTSANFEVSTPVPASASSQLFTNVITLTSDNPTGDITYTAFFDFGAVNSTAQGPVVPVPFDVSPNTGILMILGIVGINYCRQKLIT